ncbi:MAG: PKD domain-containing protein, partial [Bacteroidota bacterium]
MKSNNLRRLLFQLAAVLLMVACSEEPESPPSVVIANFEFAVDKTDYRKVQFTNLTVGGVSYSWNFGDNSPASTDENPSHIFQSPGKYSVKLSAIGAKNITSTKSVDVEIKDPLAELKKLTGETSKSWKLIRNVSTGIYPLQVGPENRSQIWYALGLGNEVGARPCLLNDEWVFNANGTFQYKTNGDFWADAGVISSTIGTDACHPSTSGNYLNVDGVNVSAWGDGQHAFALDADKKTLTVTGNGAFIGLAKAGTSAEFKVPQSSVQYKVVRLADSTVDTLTIETTIPGGYWRFVLVHYDNPAQEPAIPGAKPSANFSYAVDGPAVTFTNTSSGTGTISYSWNFGDGTSSTETSPVHNYSQDGVYTVTLTATNATGSTTKTQDVVISSAVITLSRLTGDVSKVWKLKPGVGSFKVGAGKGQGNYFGGDVDLSGDRPCAFNDEFIFKAAGNVYTYDTKGDIWTEPYMGVAFGCNPDSSLPSANAGWGSGNHTFSFTAATANTPAYITVTGTGAFIALPKAYNGGEYQN